MPITTRNIWRKEDFEYVKKGILTPREDELVARQVFPIDNETPSFAHTYTIEQMRETGEAQVVESGSESGDIPFVGEVGSAENGKLFIIRTGIRVTQDDIDAAASRRTLGKGNPYPVKEKRVDGARKFISEQENKMCFHGLIKAGKVIKPGLLNWPGIIIEPVPASGTLNSASTNPQKRSWINKTPEQKLKDLLHAKKILERKGKYKAQICLISDEDWQELLQPYSESSTHSTLDWIADKNKSDAIFPKGFIRTSDLNGEIATFKLDSLLAGGFCVLEDTADVVEMIVAKDLEVTETPFDEWKDEVRIKAVEKIGGVHVHRPKGIVVMTGTHYTE